MAAKKLLSSFSVRPKKAWTVVPVGKRVIYLMHASVTVRSVPDLDGGYTVSRFFNKTTYYGT